jgi:hypothetical protein
VQKALDLLTTERDTRAKAVILEPTHHYVRFLPQNENDIYILHDSLDLDIFHYPFDRELTPEEQQKHLDTEINGYGWQYCLVKPDFPIPTEMKWELLDYAYLQPDDQETITRSGLPYQLSADVYYDVITKSMELTGTETEPAPQTRAKWQPSGSIKYMSELPNEPNPVALQGVYVRANTALNTGHTYTRADGTFTVTKGAGGAFRNKVHYMVIWYKPDDNKWKIHDKAGKADTKRSGDVWTKSQWNPVFKDNEFAFCAAIHRALYAHYYGNYPKTAGLVKRNRLLEVKEMWGQINIYADGRSSFCEPNNSQDQISIYSRFYDVHGKSREQALLETFEEMFYALGVLSCYQQVSNTSALSYGWAGAVEYAYMQYHWIPYDHNYSAQDPAIGASLLRRGLTLAQLQTVMVKNRPADLRECRAMVKALKVIPDSTVDQIFDNPTTLF